MIILKANTTENIMENKHKLNVSLALKFQANTTESSLNMQPNSSLVTMTLITNLTTVKPVSEASLLETTVVMLSTNQTTRKPPLNSSTVAIISTTPTSKPANNSTTTLSINTTAAIATTTPSTLVNSTTTVPETQSIGE